MLKESLCWVCTGASRSASSTSSAIVFQTSTTDKDKATVLYIHSLTHFTATFIRLSRVTASDHANLFVSLFDPSLPKLPLCHFLHDEQNTHSNLSFLDAHHGLILLPVLFTSAFSFQTAHEDVCPPLRTNLLRPCNLLSPSICLRRDHLGSMG